MNLTFLQLNVNRLRNDPESKERALIVSELIEALGVDVACFQEVNPPAASPEFISQNEPFLKEATQHNYPYYRRGLHYVRWGREEAPSVVIVSKYPIIGTETYYVPGDGHTEVPAVRQANQEPQPGQQMTREQEHAWKSRCLLVVTVETPQGLVKVLSTQNSVTDRAQESERMKDMAGLVRDVVQRTDASMPVIFMGDLNHQATAESIQRILIREAGMICVTEGVKNTLSGGHKAIQAEGDFPGGLAVDHVLGKGFKGYDVKAHDISFIHPGFDHQAVVTTVEF